MMFFRSTHLFLALLPLLDAFSVSPAAQQQCSNQLIALRQSAKSSDEIFDAAAADAVLTEESTPTNNMMMTLLQDSNKRSELMEKFSATTQDLTVKAQDFWKDDRTQEFVAKAGAKAKEWTAKAQEMVQDEELLRTKVTTKAQELSAKAQEIWQDERTQEIAAKASGFAQNVLAGQVFTTVEGKVNEIKEKTEKN